MLYIPDRSFLKLLAVCAVAVRSKTGKSLSAKTPRKDSLYSVLFHHFDRFVGEYDLRFEKHCGAWRPVISRVVGQYLDCGILKNGFCTHPMSEL